MNTTLVAATIGALLAAAQPAPAQLPGMPEIPSRSAAAAPPRADSTRTSDLRCAMVRLHTALDSARRAERGMPTVVPDTAAFRMPTLRPDLSGYAMLGGERRHPPAAPDSLALRRPGVPDTAVVCPRRVR
jgi:hypothetical protein